MHSKRKFSSAIACFMCAAVCMGVLVYRGAIAAEKKTSYTVQPEIKRLNAAIDRARELGAPSSLKTTDTLIDRVHTQGRLPVIVRLRSNSPPDGNRSKATQPDIKSINSLQNAILDDVFVQTARDEIDLRVKRFSMIPAMALQVDAAGLEALLANPDVLEIIEDIPVPPTLMDSVPLIGAGLDGSFNGYTGLGQTIAILDTGVDKNHPFLSGKVVSEACFSTTVQDSGAASLCPGGASSSTALGSALACDQTIYGCDHGTHVAGIAAGGNDSFSGVAQDASIIAVQIFSRFSSGCGDAPAPCAMSYTSDQIKGLERVYALRKKYALASVNMSLGAGWSPSPCNTDPRKEAIDKLREAGIATTIASGNSGFTQALGFPGCISSAVSVGSTTRADQVSSLSNSADFLSLLAPGISIQSSVPGTTYADKSGTSMAAPHVAGAWAILKQAKPLADVTDVLGALQFNGIPVADTRIDAENRVKPRIAVTNALNSLLTPGYWIRRDDGVQIDAIGLSSGGTFSIASGWQPEDIWGTEITKIRVGVWDAPASAAVHIWQGSDAAGMELHYSQNFTPKAQQINDVVLDTPYEIDRSKELFIGWSATHSPGEYPCALDAAANKDQPESWLLFDATWQDAGLDGDWIVHARIEGCRLDISHKKLLAEKLVKDKKITLKISGGENFDPDGGIDAGPLFLLRTKINTKKNMLKIKALVPAGLSPGTIMIRIGDCYGEIEIL